MLADSSCLAQRTRRGAIDYQLKRAIKLRGLMDLLTALAGHLENKGVGKVGESIFVSEMPSETEGFCCSRPARS